MSFIGKAIGSITGSDKAAQAATTGAQISADAQREGLAYLKETEAVPQELRRQALGVLGGLYGTGSVTPDDALNTLKMSPMYQAILNTRGAGEESILRNAAATGGLRSGNVQDNLARFNSDLEIKALLQGLGGIESLAQLPSNANAIANQISGIGQTLGQGQVAAGQAVAAGRGAVTAGLLGAASGYAGSSAGSAQLAGSFSDSRLKSNVKPAGTRNGLPWYTWTWNKEAEKLGLFGNDEGFMAHEVMQTKPEAIRLNGEYLTVDYKALGVQ